MSFVEGLKCKECGREYPKQPIYVCEYCFGPLEVVYNYREIKNVFTKQILQNRPKNLWRYKELLPVDGEPICGLNSGFTPLFEAKNLAKVLGVKRYT